MVIEARKIPIQEVRFKIQEVRFKVDGVPTPQGSMRALTARGEVGGRPIIVQGGSASSRERLMAWRVMVALKARETGVRFTGAVAVSLRFYLPRPKSAPKRTRYPAKKPDLDKLVRAVFDALADSGMLADDALVVSLAATKSFAEHQDPCVQITVLAME